MQTYLKLPLFYRIAYLLSNIYDKQLFCLIQVICPTIILFIYSNLDVYSKIHFYLFIFLGWKANMYACILPNALDPKDISSS